MRALRCGVSCDVSVLYSNIVCIYSCRRLYVNLNHDNITLRLRNSNNNGISMELITVDAVDTVRQSEGTLVVVEDTHISASTNKECTETRVCFSLAKYSDSVFVCAHTHIRRSFLCTMLHTLLDLAAHCWSTHLHSHQPFGSNPLGIIRQMSMSVVANAKSRTMHYDAVVLVVHHPR
eukprot:m.936655 g.936655  ORF g.936655 m.936655 type:complete len:177 (+) comp23810_c3_seq3:409-939(+)